VFYIGTTRKKNKWTLYPLAALSDNLFDSFNVSEITSYVTPHCTEGNCAQDELWNGKEAEVLRNLRALIQAAQEPFSSTKKEIDFHSVGYSRITADQSVFYERYNSCLSIPSASEAHD